MKDKKERKKTAFTVCASLTALLLVLSCLYVLRALDSYALSEGLNEGIEKEALAEGIPDDNEMIKVDHDKLLDINDDYIGWLIIPGTDISYPVCYSQDHEKYLYTAFGGEDSREGTLFTDCRCRKDLTGWNTIIYGHNMKNGSMFGGLKNYLNEEYFRKYRTLFIYTPEKIHEYRIYAVYHTDKDSDTYQTDFDPMSFLLWTKKVREDSLFKTDQEPDIFDNMLTLSTCRGGRRRLVVIFREVRMDELFDTLIKPRDTNENEYLYSGMPL